MVPSTTAHLVIWAVSMFIGMFGARACPEGQVCEEEKGQPGLYLVQKQARQVLSADSSTREAEATYTLIVANAYCTNRQYALCGYGPKTIQACGDCCVSNYGSTVTNFHYSIADKFCGCTNAGEDCVQKHEVGHSVYSITVPATGTPTIAPTTDAPTTAVPTTEAPTTEAPTTDAPTTEAPTTKAPTTAVPTTDAPATAAPTTAVPTTEAPTTAIFIEGPAGTSSCPTGYSHITSDAKCSQAASALGFEYNGPPGNSANWMGRCSHSDPPGGKLYFSQNSAGFTSDKGAPICEFQATSPTPSPTPLPPVQTSSPTSVQAPATAVGDPHLVNTRGEAFSIFTSGQVEFVRVPYASVTESADFTVHATIQSVGETNTCKEAHFITGVFFGGSWLKGKPLEISVDATRPGATRKEMKVLLGGVPVLPSSERIDLGDKVSLDMYGNHKIVLLVNGASVAVELQNFFLNVDAGSFMKLSQKIGGLLGEDDHSAVSVKPAGCEKELLSKNHQLVHSSARCQMEVGKAVLEPASASGDPHMINVVGEKFDIVETDHLGSFE